MACWLETQRNRQLARTCGHVSYNPIQSTPYSPIGPTINQSCLVDFVAVARRCSTRDKAVAPQVPSFGPDDVRWLAESRPSTVFFFSSFFILSKFSSFPPTKTFSLLFFLFFLFFSSFLLFFFSPASCAMSRCLRLAIADVKPTPLRDPQSMVALVFDCTESTLPSHHLDFASHTGSALLA